MLDEQVIRVCSEKSSGGEERSLCRDPEHRQNVIGLYKREICPLEAGGVGLFSWWVFEVEIREVERIEGVFTVKERDRKPQREKEERMKDLANR